MDCTPTSVIASKKQTKCHCNVKIISLINKDGHIFTVEHFHFIWSYFPKWHIICAVPYQFHSLLCCQILINAILKKSFHRGKLSCRRKLKLFMSSICDIYVDTGIQLSSTKTAFSVQKGGFSYGDILVNLNSPEFQLTSSVCSCLNLTENMMRLVSVR